MNFKKLFKKEPTKTRMEEYKKNIGLDLYSKFEMEHKCKIITPFGNEYELKGEFHGIKGLTSYEGLSIHIYDSYGNQVDYTNLVGGINPDKNSFHLGSINNMCGIKSSGFATCMMVMLLNMMVHYNTIVDTDYIITSVNGTIQPLGNSRHVKNFYGSLDGLTSTDGQYQFLLDQDSFEKNILKLYIKKTNT